MKLRWAAGCLGALLCLVAACAPETHNQNAVLSYRLEAVPGGEWEVEARFEGLARDKPQLRMLATWGSFSDLGAKLEDLVAIDDAGDTLQVLRSTDARFSVWEVGREVDGPITVRYRIVPYGPFESPEATYIGEHEALALGYCVFLAPDEISDYLPVPITVSVSTPWPTWTSWGEDGPETLHDLWSSVVVAGDFREIALSKGDTRVRVLTDSSWSGTLGLTVANRLLPVLSRMRDMFGKAPRGDDLHVLALFRTAPAEGPRSFMIGVSEERSFLCLATPDRYRDMNALTALAAHECLHFYLGGAVTAEAEPPFQNNPELIWFFEGMTEYMAYKLMRETEVMNPEALEQVRRVKGEKIVRRALADMRLSDAARMYQWPEVYELIYNKGYFLAEALDAYMTETCGPQALEEALRDVFEQNNFYVTHRHLQQDVLLQVLNTRCPGAADWIRTYIIQNRPLPGREWAEMKKATPEGAAYTR